jgi:hypothetical protein
MPLNLTQFDFQLDNSIPTRRVLHLQFGPADVQAALHQAAAKLRPDVEVPGFRQGKAPLAQVLRHHRERVQVQALANLRSSGLDQALPKLDLGDQPLTPPQPHGKQPRLRLGQGAALSVSYLVDPTGISRNPEHPEADQGAVIPGSQALAAVPQPMGIPTGPQLPQAPGTPGTPTLAGVPVLPGMDAATAGPAWPGASPASGSLPED